jgi:hypothetical protein
MKCDVEYTDEFGAFWKTLSEDEQEDIAAIIDLLEEKGIELPFPFSTGVEGSKHSHMRELRVQSKSNPLRILYAFDPRRAAVLLIGGNKRGDKRWYKTYVPIADKLYADHLVELKKEGLL